MIFSKTIQIQEFYYLKKKFGQETYKKLNDINNST